MKIVYVCSNHISDQYRTLWRCQNIASAITHTGLHHAVVLDIVSFSNQDALSLGICADADIIVIHTYLLENVIQAVQYWKHFNKTIILDIDEALDLLSPDMEGYHFWHDGQPILSHNLYQKCQGQLKISPPPIEQLKWALSLVDAVTVPTSRLAADWDTFTKVVEIPDYIDLDQYLTQKTECKSRHELCIGMGGDPVSMKTMINSGLLSALETVYELRPQIRFMFSGASMDLFARLRIPGDRKVVYSWLPPDDWLFQLANIDIGIAPIDSDYDLRSSWRKVLEYLGLKIPWIASDHLPYRDLRQYGILVKNTSSAWTGALLKIIDQFEMYHQQAADEPYLFVLGQDIHENISNILTVYESILSDASIARVSV